MKSLNPNKAKLLLLFTRDPFVKLANEELEYYSSEDDFLIGFVSLDKKDQTFHAMLFDRDSRNKYCLVSMNLDLDSIEDARNALKDMMSTYVRNDEALKKELPTNDFFSPIVKPEQQHPYFTMLLDKDGFFTAAKSVIEELSFHYEDRDGNFVDQFQSKNGFDARIWELYLWCYFREENFYFNYDYTAPDFLIEKMGHEIAIEAVHINRKQRLDEPANIPTVEEIFKKMENEIPLMYGSPLYSKLNHKYRNLHYWDLPHVKGKPLLYAIADFHADMSMTWSFSGIVNILYGINQKVIHNDDGTISLENESGITFQKKESSIKPLFLDDKFKYVSAILFSPCGTLSKFNRMGIQAGYGDNKNKLYQIKMCYNSSPNAILPDVIGKVVNEDCRETWADGIQIFHNPFAEISLNPDFFPNAGHHFYKDGLLRSIVPDGHTISTITHNIKNFPIDPPLFDLHSSEDYDKVIKKWRM
jgi:hypothetical protein